MAFPFLMVQSLDENQGPSQVHGHGPWLMCEVALTNSDRRIVEMWISSPTQFLSLVLNAQADYGHVKKNYKAYM